MPPVAMRASLANPATAPLRSPLRALLRDPYGVLLFLGLLALLCLLLDIGPIKSLLRSVRWGVLGLLALAGLGWAGTTFSRRLPAAHWWLMGLLAISAASCAWSIDSWYSIQRWFSVLLLYIAVFIGAWGWLQRRNNVLLGGEILYLLTLVVTAISVVHLGGEEILDRTERATGAMGKATATGGFAAATIPVLLWKIRYSSGFTRLVTQFALLLQGYLLFFSGARGALLASSIGLLALLWFNYRRWRPLVLATGLVMALFSAVGFVGLDSLPDYIVRRESLETAAGRFVRSEALLAVWKKRPLRGYGFGTGRLLIASDPEALNIYLEGETKTNKAQRLIRLQEKGVAFEIQPHNDHVERLAETGVLGWLCFAGMWCSLLLCIPKLIRAGPGIVPDLGRYLLASMWFLFVDTMLHSGMFAVGNGPTAMQWFFLMLCLACAEQAAAWNRMRSRLAPRVSGPAFATAGHGIPTAG